MASNSASISNVKVGELPAYLQRIKLNKIPSGFMGMIARYQKKYILCKSGKMTPFFHVAGLCILINYWVEYKHLKRKCSCFLPENNNDAKEYITKLIYDILVELWVPILLNNEHPP